MFTTVIGSYPLKYSDLGADAIRQAIDDQLQAGIDLVTDGQTRYDMIEYFARAIEGYTYDGKSVITGKIGHGRPDQFVEDLRIARSLAPRVKGLITGPVNLSGRSDPEISIICFLPPARERIHSACSWVFEVIHIGAVGYAREPSRSDTRLFSAEVLVRKLANFKRACRLR